MGIRLIVPVAATIDVASAVLAAGAFVALFRFKAGMIPTLAGSVAAGALWHLAFGG